MTAAAEITPGTLIDNRYHIQKILGQGGFGRTYLAADNRRFGELCVLKEFAPLGSDEYVMQKARELFQREAKILHGLNHPQIPKFLAWFEDNGRLFIGQEYVNGKTYWGLLQERQQRGLAFTEAEVVLWLRDLLTVLAYVHDRKIIHRDISPDNIMLPDGNNLPVLIDFGVVKEAATQLIGSNPDNSLIQASIVVGKFGYAPYEQIRLGQCSARTDLYALAVTAVVLLTGKHPNGFIDRDTLEWRWHSMVQLDPGLVAILDKLMAEKPQDRYASAQAVLAELQPLILRAATMLSSTVPPTFVGQSLETAIATPRPLPSPVIPSDTTAGISHNTNHDITQPDWDGQVAESTHHSTAEATEMMPVTNRLTHEGERLPVMLSSPSGAFASTEATEVVAIAGRVPPTPSISKPWLTARHLLAIAPITVLVLGVVVLAGVSPHIAPLCQPLNNCTREQEVSNRYREAVQQAEIAITAAKSATTIATLEPAIQQLDAALEQIDAQLDQVSQESELFRQMDSSLKAYEAQHAAFTDQLKRETTAATLLNQAAATAQAATATARAGTLSAYESAKTQWQSALNTLDQIAENTFVAEQVKTRSQQYRNQLAEIERLIASEADDPASPSPNAAASPTPSATPNRVSAPAPTTRPSARSSPRPSPRANPQSTPQSSPRPSNSPSSVRESPQPAPAPQPTVDQKPSAPSAPVTVPPLPPPPPAPLVCPGSVC